MPTLKEKIIDFIKYHNAFTIGLVLALVFGGLIFASEDVRNAVIGEEVVTQERGIDNKAILETDLESYDPQMKVENVTEDDKNYYVDYSFQTLGIQDNIWQPIRRDLSMIIDKSSLEGGDLGLYVQKQLSEIAQNELAYLKQVQAAEKEKGTTQIVRTTEYTGLIGLVLDVKNAILPGYEPVVKNDQLSVITDSNDDLNNDQLSVIDNETEQQPQQEQNDNQPLETQPENSEVPAAELLPQESAPLVPSETATSTVDQ